MVFLSVLDIMEAIKDILKSMAPEHDNHDFETEALKGELIDAFALVRVPHPTKSSS